MKVFSNKQSIKALSSQYKAVLNIKDNEIYSDPLFPNDNSSIFSINPIYKDRNPQTPQSFFPIEQTFLISQFSSLPKDKQYTWKRLSELNIDYTIYSQFGSLTNDIIPGEIGNCYFISALKILSEHPERIRNIIPLTNNTESNTKPNAFWFWCYINGIKTHIVVDDYFPMFDEETLAFCRLNPKTNHIWPLILEKGWAKINSSYEDTITGCISDAFHFLTPCPIKHYYHDIQYDNLFNKICKALDDGFIVCCDIHSSNDNVLLRKLGVISNHAYKIIGHGELRDSRGKAYNLLKINNPFLTTTWIGKWSPYSNMWTPQYKKHLNYDPDKEKDVYWIEMNDYLKYYTTTYICYLHDNYSYKSNKISIGGINDIFTCAKIIIKDNKDSNINTDSLEQLKEELTSISTNKGKKVNSMNSYFIINFKTKRIQTNLKQKETYEHIFMNITVFKQDSEGKLKFIDSICGKDERMFIPITNLTPGEYIIAINFPYLSHNKYSISNTFSINPSRPNNITVGVYSQFQENTIIITEYNQDHFERNIIRSLIEKSKNNSHLYYFDKEKENDTSRSINFENEKGSFGYLVIDNKSEGCLYESVNFCEFDNVNLISFIIQPKKFTSHKDKSKHLNNNNIIETNDNLIDDINTREYISILSSMHNAIEEESKINAISLPNESIKISQDNPFEILIKVCSFSICVLIFEKCDEYSAVDVHSQIAFRYPLYVVLKETKTSSTKTRLKYNDKSVEIYECIIEHSSGVVFYYKNKTKDMEIKVNIMFKEMNNLKYGMVSDDLVYGAVKLTNNNHKNNNNTSNDVYLHIKPGENKFIEMRSKNIFESFSYSFDINYEIFYARAVNNN